MKRRVCHYDPGRILHLKGKVVCVASGPAILADVERSDFGTAPRLEFPDRARIACRVVIITTCTRVEDRQLPARQVQHLGSSISFKLRQEVKDARDRCHIIIFFLSSRASVGATHKTSIYDESEN